MGKVIRVLGVDPGATMGLALIETDGVSFKGLEARVGRFDAIDSYLPGVDLVAIETFEYQGPKRARTIGQVAYGVGLAVGHCKARGARVTVIARTDVLRALKLRGNASKGACRQAVSAFLGMTFEGEHTADAGAVALVAGLRFGPDFSSVRDL